MNSIGVLGALSVNSIGVLGTPAFGVLGTKIPEKTFIIKSLKNRNARARVLTYIIFNVFHRQNLWITPNRLNDLKLNSKTTAAQIESAVSFLSRYVSTTGCSISFSVEQRRREWFCEKQSLGFTKEIISGFF